MLNLCRSGASGFDSLTLREIWGPAYRVCIKSKYLDQSMTLALLKLVTFHFFSAKGQLISKWFFGVVNFLQKMNENKST